MLEEKNCVSAERRQFIRTIGGSLLGLGLLAGCGGGSGGGPSTAPTSGTTPTGGSGATPTPTPTSAPSSAQSPLIIVADNGDVLKIIDGQPAMLLLSLRNFDGKNVDVFGSRDERGLPRRIFQTVVWEPNQGPAAGVRAYYDAQGRPYAIKNEATGQYTTLGYDASNTNVTVRFFNTNEQLLGGGVITGQGNSYSVQPLSGAATRRAPVSIADLPRLSANVTTKRGGYLASPANGSGSKPVEPGAGVSVITFYRSPKEYAQALLAGLQNEIQVLGFTRQFFQDVALGAAAAGTLALMGMPVAVAAGIGAAMYTALLVPEIFNVARDYVQQDRVDPLAGFFDEDEGWLLP